ncbi:unnamed protein product [Adineta steineri]|uniref:Uncharacterized protein n=1 Tax=Adineta steineri TaxID=433720 RepID=A0A814K1C2_9BILA|nr:unnamed protein product [Adineta steineri]CAF1121272.1 unnamed protein product [Adineta steineri]
MAHKRPISSIKLMPTNTELLTKTNENIHQRFTNMKTIDITSRLGQFAWRQIAPSTISLPVIFRHSHREEYLCVQMINIHLLSNFSSEIISYCMNQLPIHYFSLTEYEAKLFQYINKFHSNSFLSKNNQLNYSRLDLVYITPFIPFVQFYQFISLHSQTIKDNEIWISSKYNKQTIERGKQSMDDKHLPEKDIGSSSNGYKSNNSYCRLIVFHGKEIKSYSTTSSINSNETILCLSIKDIVLTYFPWMPFEKFVDLCRIKHILRYKPDKSTHSDLSLRLINLHQLEQHWEFFNQQFIPKTQPISPQQSIVDQKNNNEKCSIEDSLLSTNNSHDNESKSTSNIIEQSFEKFSENIQSYPQEHGSSSPSQDKNSSCQNDVIESVDNEQTLLQNNSVMDQQKEIIQEQEQEQQPQHEDFPEETDVNKEQNEVIIDSSENIQEQTIPTTIENKDLKRKRRRSQRSFLTMKRRKQKSSKSMSNEKFQWWIQKYSIEPISIVLDRTYITSD